MDSTMLPRDRHRGSIGTRFGGCPHTGVWCEGARRLQLMERALELAVSSRCRPQARSSGPSFAPDRTEARAIETLLSVIEHTLLVALHGVSAVTGFASVFASSTCEAVTGHAAAESDHMVRCTSL